MHRPLDGRDNLNRAGKSLQSDSARKGLSSVENASVGSVIEKRFTKYATEGHRLPYWAVRNDHIWTSRNGNPLNARSFKDGQRGSRYKTDIDFVFANGKKIIFVDVKGYASKKFYWNAFFLNDFRIRDGLTSFKTNKNGEPVSLSSSMKLALNQYKEILPDCNIKTILLFVPVGRESMIDYSQRANDNLLPSNVSFLRAPGNIHSYKIEEGFREINKHLGPEEIQVPRHVQDVFDTHAMK